jgi:Kef-type K+ transport system membrane component KefB
MPEVSFENLLIICAIAAAAPLLAALRPRLRIPSAVLEIVAGVVLGPSVLNLVHIDLPVQILALVGLAFLLFLAGLEIDARQLRGRVLGLAVVGYGLTLLLGYGVGTGFAAADLQRHAGDGVHDVATEGILDDEIVDVEQRFVRGGLLHHALASAWTPIGWKQA